MSSVMSVCCCGICYNHLFGAVKTIISETGGGGQRVGLCVTWLLRNSLALRVKRAGEGSPFVSEKLGQTFTVNGW